MNEDWTEDDQREWEMEQKIKQLEMFEDKIHLDKELKDEKWKRAIYVKWIHEIFKRKDAGECPKCGVRKWYQLATGFRAKWQCDGCGLILSKKDIHKANKWYDYITLHAREEVRRIEKARRRSRSIKTYESDDV
jgi:rubredoxin